MYNKISLLYYKISKTKQHFKNLKKLHFLHKLVSAVPLPKFLHHDPDSDESGHIRNISLQDCLPDSTLVMSVLSERILTI